MKYFLITIKQQERPASITKTITLVIDTTPFQWMLDWNPSVKHETCLIYSEEITKEQYEAWGEKENTIYE